MNVLILQYCVIFYLFIYLFVSGITFWGSKTPSIFFNSIFSGRKVNQVGILWGVKSKKLLIVFKCAGKTKEKLRKNGIFSQKKIIKFNFYERLKFKFTR